MRSLMTRSLVPILLLLATMGMVARAGGGDEALRREPLFRIERSHNANVVQYDAQLGKDDRLDGDEPIIVYWVRLAENGEHRKLSWMEQQLAYGFRCLSARADTVVIRMNAGIRRPIRVFRLGEHYRAVTRVSGANAILETVFVESKGDGGSTKVRSISLRGRDLETGEIRAETIEP